MKLNYRGVSYEYNAPKVEYGDPTQVGKYRGLDIRFRNIKKAPVLQPTLDLIYRGVAHTANPAPATETQTEKVPALSVQDRARVLMMDRHRSVKRRQQAMLARSDERVGLDASQASTFWNHIQGKVHPSFGENYDRSHAALS
ncbi:DUF4278 domain-containing protein [Leptolyngbya ohadii]|uniref:DUF4278 domain-containing protein n=1 Tax=Leptolyngbya ohadii TaxID=1962290 RepID=UPI000B59DF62|nr:DUF4278 domain-containing protein [Leptolyngbya ohadii]